MTTVDAVIIGAGHQGLTTALYLARAGWTVEVVERNSEIGGATRSGQVTEPGLEHDLYATNLNLFASSPVYAEFADDLARHGFSLVRSDMPYANVYPDGRSLRIYNDAARTVFGLGEHDPEDLEGWQTLHELYVDFVSHLMPVYGQPLPSVAAGRTAVRALRRLGPRRVLELVQLMACSTRELGDRWFRTDEAKALIACWGMHLDFGPDVAFGAMFPFIETFADMENGISIAEGGIGALPRALAALVVEAGGHVRTGQPVIEVLTDGRDARGVMLADGSTITARRAVIAGTAPTQLFGELLKGDSAGETAGRSHAEMFTYGPGSMMVHLSLDGPVTWSAHPDLSDFAYVHVAPYVDDLARTYQQAMAGVLPDRPMLVVGQTSRVDPSRTPDDREVLWIQVRSVPSVIKGDSLGEISETSWDMVKEAMADRVLDDLENYAPGLRGLIRERSVFSPADLEAQNPNLVGGDALAGSHHVAQNFLFRPWLGASTYESGVPRLRMVGASTWPGGGVNALSGYLLASRLLRRPYLRPRRRHR
jgi:phytoene dehydrogenase-like protein